MSKCSLCRIDDPSHTKRYTCIICGREVCYHCLMWDNITDDFDTIPDTCSKCSCDKLYPNSKFKIGDWVTHPVGCLENPRRIGVVTHIEGSNGENGDIYILRNTDDPDRVITAYEKYLTLVMDEKDWKEKEA